MIYLLVFLFAFFAIRLIGKSTHPSFLCLLLALGLGLFAAFRGPDVANDYVVYLDWYSDARHGIRTLDYLVYFEWFFYKFMELCAISRVPFPVYLALVAICSIYIKLFVLKKFSSSTIAFSFVVFLYCESFYLLHEFTQIRAGIAMSMLFVAFWCLMESRFWLAYLFIVIASGFHLSALLAAPLPLLAFGRTPRYNWSLVGLTCLFMLTRMMGVSLTQSLGAFISNWEPRLGIYVSYAEMENASSANSFSIPSLILLLVSLSILFNPRFIREGDSDEFKGLQALARCLLISLWPILLFPEFQEIAARTHELLSVALLLAAAIVFSKPDFIPTKALMFLWGGANLYIYVFRPLSLVRSYVVIN